MLVLSRQRNETIMIGDEIEITIVDIKGDKVRVGISAPRTVAVHRKEVYLAIKEENLRAQEATSALDATQLGALFGPGAFPGVAKPAATTPPTPDQQK